MGSERDQYLTAPRLAARVTALVERVQEERFAADVALPTILKHPRESWRAKLAISGDVHTVGMIEALV